MRKTPKTFEQYLRDGNESGNQEFRLVIQSDGQGVEFYIHPLGKDGESRNFEVCDGVIEDVTRWLPLSDQEAAGETEWMT